MKLSTLALAGLLSAAAAPAPAQFMDMRKAPSLKSVNAEGELAITNARPASFAAAAASAVTEARDGDDLWVAVRTSKPLSTYALVSLHAGAPEYYELQIDVLRGEDDRAYNSCFWVLTPAEARASELILSLSPPSVRSVPVSGGRYTKVAKAGCWLATVAEDDDRPGRWNNRIALVSMNPDHRPAEVVAVAPLTADVPDGFPRWNATVNKRCDGRALARNGAPAVCPK